MYSRRMEVGRLAELWRKRKRKGKRICPYVCSLQLHKVLYDVQYQRTRSLSAEQMARKHKGVLKLNGVE